MDELPRMREHQVVIRDLYRSPPPSQVAWILAGAAAFLYPFTLYLGFAARRPLPALLQFGWWEELAPVLGIEFMIVGALILRRHPRHSVGWLALVGGFSTSLSAFAGSYAGYSLSHGQFLQATGFAVWLRGWLWFAGLSFLFILIPALFPDGALPSRRWRPIVWAVAAGCTMQLVNVSLTQAMFGFPQADGPYPRLGWLLGPLSPLAGALFLFPIFAVVAALVVRFRRSSPAVRQQLKWFLAAVALQAAVWAVSQATNAVTEVAPYFDLLVPVALLLVPLAIGVAILRHRLYDIDIVISRGLVYAGLVAFITLAYLVVVVGIEFAVGTGGRPNVPLSVVAMALVVVLIQPVRVRLQRLANRLVYGVPSEPYAVLAQLAKTPAAGDLGDALAQIAQAVAKGMSSRRARVRLLLPGGQARVATWPPDATGNFGQSFDVRDGGETVGEIEVDGSGDLGLTEALTAQAGHALHTLRLSAELDARLAQLEEQAQEVTASRTRLVQAQEVERRRLERDLHDGIQQDLVVLIAKAGLARKQLERDPSSAAATLAELQRSAQHAIADLRSLARGIHPAVLSSRGLVEAIDSMAARMPVGVRVDADPTVREVRFAPEIEGAAYFVVAEALANVLKHSGATEATVTISASDSWLRLAIADDGRGFDLGAVRESGLRGLRDRIEALGGHVEIVSQGSGTRLDASLPALNGSHV
ncbi:MAG: sensor histidine kinase [Candidatus Dormibacteraeota bacterium]|nr:sensor histidine kinase [Candidatus Dormibacteraeota bacterium]